MKKLVTTLALAGILASVVTACGRPAATTNNNASTAASGSGSASGQHMVLKFSHVVAEDTPKHKAALKFADLVKQKSNGRIEVQVFPNNTLYNDKDELDALKNGQVNFIAPATSKISNVPQWQLIDLPYLFRDQDHFYKVMNGPVGEKLYAALQPQGMLGLAAWDSGYRNVTAKKEVVHPQDMAGLKFRVQPGKVYDLLMKQANAIPVPMAFGEVYQALQSGTIDAQENVNTNIQSSKFYEVNKYFTNTEHAFLSYVVLTNDKWFNSLSADDQKIIKDAAKEAADYNKQLVADMNKQALDKMKQAGLQVHTQTPEERQEWTKFFQPVIEKMAPEIGADLIKQVQETK